MFRSRSQLFNKHLGKNQECPFKPPQHSRSSSFSKLSMLQQQHDVTGPSPGRIAGYRWVRGRGYVQKGKERRRFLAARSRRRKLMQRVERMKFLASRRRRRRLLMQRAKENSTRN